LEFEGMSHDSPVISLTRDVEAIQIPSGLTKKLHKGTPVILTQALGGTYTVVVENSAGLFRILAEDADSLGKAPAPESKNGATPAPSGGPLNEDDLWAQLKTCYDPEIPVNIVDLGLIYSLEIKPQDGGGNLVEVKMTLTAPGCGMGPSIASDAQRKILTVPGVTDAQVDVVWDPPWSAERISQDGKAKLGMI
jgi:probable FeS assembly SUF system protein SufT